MIMGLSCLGLALNLFGADETVAGLPDLRDIRYLARMSMQNDCWNTPAFELNAAMDYHDTLARLLNDGSIIVYDLNAKRAYKFKLSDLADCDVTMNQFSDMELTMVGDQLMLICDGENIPVTKENLSRS